LIIDLEARYKNVSDFGEILPFPVLRPPYGIIGLLDGDGYNGACK